MASFRSGHRRLGGATPTAPTAPAGRGRRRGGFGGLLADAINKLDASQAQAECRHLDRHRQVDGHLLGRDERRAGEPRLQLAVQVRNKRPTRTTTSSGMQIQVRRKMALERSGRFGAASSRAASSRCGDRPARRRDLLLHVPVRLDRELRDARSGQDPSEVGQMTKALDSAGVPYKLANGGTEIDVPARRSRRRSRARPRRGSAAAASRAAALQQDEPRDDRLPAAGPLPAARSKARSTRRSSRSRV